MLLFLDAASRKNVARFAEKYEIFYHFSLQLLSPKTKVYFEINVSQIHLGLQVVNIRNSGTWKLSLFQNTGKNCVTSIDFHYFSLVVFISPSIFFRQTDRQTDRQTNTGGNSICCPSIYRRAV